MSPVTYKDSGVDIDKADALKRGLKETLKTEESRVLNAVGAFSSLFDLSNLEGIEHPVLCLKMEEPGSKQLLAAQHGRLASVGVDLVNHLINDTIMNGGRPLAILDTIVCGKLNSDEVSALIASMVHAAKAQNCSLVGGETSEQPRVLNEGTYILSAACVGVVDKGKIIDGSHIAPRDVIYALASNGVHTNGYTLVRSLLDKDNSLAEITCGSETFLEAVLRPHLCYNLPLQEAFATTSLHGLAHITGGGVRDNIKRILPESVSAKIDLGLIKTLPVFSLIQQAGGVPEEDMLRTFNCGVGAVAIGRAEDCEKLEAICSSHGFESYQIGLIESGDGSVEFDGKMNFS